MREIVFDAPCSKADVLLVSMPCAPLHVPSIGLGLLSAIAKHKDVVCKTLYFTFPFAEKVGIDLYSQIAAGYPATHALLGDWIFSDSLFPHSMADGKQYLESILLPELERSKSKGKLTDTQAQAFAEGVVAARASATRFVNECAAIAASYSPRLVGFTSVFQQQTAALSLAKALKEANTGIITLLAERTANFPWVSS